MFAFLPFNVGPWELILILVILLIIVGPGKLPQVGRSLGEALQNFRKSKDEDADEDNDDKPGK
ncbi:MAG: twin-arginine translocase TatA/TatE family subunit [Syntrophomonadaceae bacterium]|nr:twin-arginine translocase TatA/TatE family subunit [Syntrophomonadaceae bacterium]